MSCCCCRCDRPPDREVLERQIDEWRDYAREMADRYYRGYMDEARKLASGWRQSAHNDYWLMVYLLKEVCPEWPSEDVARRAYEKMLASGDNIRANEIRPVSCLHFQQEADHGRSAEE